MTSLMLKDFKTCRSSGCQTTWTLSRLVLRHNNQTAMPSMHTVTMCHLTECANQFRCRRRCRVFNQKEGCAVRYISLLRLHMPSNMFRELSGSKRTFSIGFFTGRKHAVRQIQNLSAARLFFLYHPQITSEAHHHFL